MTKPLIHSNSNCTRVFELDLLSLFGYALSTALVLLMLAAHTPTHMHSVHTPFMSLRFDRIVTRYQLHLVNGCAARILLYCREDSQATHSDKMMYSGLLGNA